MSVHGVMGFVMRRSPIRAATAMRTGSSMMYAGSVNARAGSVALMTYCTRRIWAGRSACVTVIRSATSTIASTR